ncbi:MAG: hypothetical protein VXX06_09200 [Pseudomonadota bacterium]|nr:hypothetical protein [Pseudomonadota bacterium]
MSRLADAESKLTAALDALEAAITAARGTPDPGDAGLDRKAILAEIGQIDGQIAGAMKAIETAQRATGDEGGRA